MQWLLGTMQSPNLWLFMKPGIDSASLCSLAGWYDNPICRTSGLPGSLNVSKFGLWNFRTIYGGQEPSRNRVVVRPGRLHKLVKSIPGLLKSLKLSSLASFCVTCFVMVFFSSEIRKISYCVPVEYWGRMFIVHSLNIVSHIQGAKIDVANELDDV